MTMSGDSTSNRKVNYDSRHIALRVENYPGSKHTNISSSTPAVRLIGVDSSVDHSSETAVKGWIGKFTEITTVFNESPLSNRLPKFTIQDVVRILKGMNGDHASAEKSTANGLRDWKTEMTLLKMGEDELESRTAADVMIYLSWWSQNMIQDAGGLEVWNSLSGTERAKQEAALMKEIKLHLGTAAYDKLTDPERRELDLFIWAGCCMHKDLNSFKGGNSMMTAWWEKTSTPSPITLANKQNASVLKRILDPATASDGPLTNNEVTALESSTRGGVKAVALAGAIFNNKDDKKGHGDSHVYHFTEIMGPKSNFRRFPDTSNTRFGSYGEAAGELLAHLDQYREFLRLIKDKKKVPAWNNLELNVYRALHDIPTLTEMAAMALYSQAVTHPYMRIIRGPGTENVNVLDLKIFHMSVRKFIQGIIDEPEHLVSAEASPALGSLDGKDWERGDTINAIKKLIPLLPNLQEVTVAFFEGSLSTWVRFTSEFAPGGLIDTATADELAMAWMPTTNDANEGALGAFRVQLRNTPTMTMHQYNAQAMYARNDTQAFMDAKLTEAVDHMYLMRKARELDSSGLEKQRKAAQVEFDLRVAKVQREKAAEKKKSEIAYLHSCLGMRLMQESDVTDRRTVKELDQQLDLLQKFGGDSDLPKTKKARGLKAEKQRLLKEALHSYFRRLEDGQSSIISNIEKLLYSLEKETPEAAVAHKEWEEEEDIEMEE